MRMKHEQRRKVIWKKYFKLGYNQMVYNLERPNLWVHIDKAFAIDFDHNATFTEAWPFRENCSWAYTGYVDGYNFVEPFVHLVFQHFPDLEALWEKWYHSHFVAEAVEHNNTI